MVQRSQTTTFSNFFEKNSIFYLLSLDECRKMRYNKNEEEFFQFLSFHEEDVCAECRPHANVFSVFMGIFLLFRIFYAILLKEIKTATAKNGGCMIYITFFGDFSLTQNDVTLSAKQSRAGRLFRALAYLVKNRNRVIETAEFSRFLHNDKDFSRYKNESLVKTTLHRLRRMLSVFGTKETIILQNGCIAFSQTLVFSSDTERFEKLLTAFKSAENEEKLALFEEITALYRGRFLASFAGESFTMPEAERYHRAFVALCNDALELLIAKGEYQKAHGKAQRLVPIDPFCESFHYYQIYALMLSGDRALAKTLYQNVSECYRREFHISLSARFHALKPLLQPKSLFDANSCDEALTALSDASDKERNPAYVSEPVDLFRTASLLTEGYLVFIKGDLDKVLPYLTDIFDSKTLYSHLSEKALFLITTLDGDSFEKKYRTLQTVINYGHIMANTEYRKIGINSGIYPKKKSANN